MNRIKNHAESSKTSISWNRIEWQANNRFLDIFHAEEYFLFKDLLKTNTNNCVDSCLVDDVEGRPAMDDEHEGNVLKTVGVPRDCILKRS